MLHVIVFVHAQAVPLVVGLACLIVGVFVLLCIFASARSIGEGIFANEASIYVACSHGWFVHAFMLAIPPRPPVSAGFCLWVWALALSHMRGKSQQHQQSHSLFRIAAQVVDVVTIAVSIAVTMRCPECALRLSCVLAFGVLV